MGQHKRTQRGYHRHTLGQETRPCNKCGLVKSLNDFLTNGKHPDGTARARSICRNCGSGHLGRHTEPHRCSVCGEVKAPEDFPGTKRTYTCRACVNTKHYAYVRGAGYARHLARMVAYQKRKYRDDQTFRDKNAAHGAVYMALKFGCLSRPEKCSRCSTAGRIEGHHHLGYAPENHLDVVWLCKRCHTKADRASAGGPR